MTNNQIIASSIMQQLGGSKFKAMTGCKDVYAIDNGLQFKLPSRFAKKSINCVQIKLNGNDLYDVSFIAITNRKDPKFGVRMPFAKDVSKFEDIYCDQLQEIFTRETGLDTHL